MTIALECSEIENMGDALSLDVLDEYISKTIVFTPPLANNGMVIYMATVILDGFGGCYQTI